MNEGYGIKPSLLRPFVESEFAPSGVSAFRASWRWLLEVPTVAKRHSRHVCGWRSDLCNEFENGWDGPDAEKAGEASKVARGKARAKLGKQRQLKGTAFLAS